MREPLVVEQEISLKGMILRATSYFQEVVKYWKIITFLVILFACIMGLSAYLTKDTYPAEITFMVNENEGSGSGGVGALLGQFGFGSTNGDYNLGKMIELANSLNIISTALLSEGVVEGKKDFLANHIIREYNFHKEWIKPEYGLNRFLFKSSNVEEFSYKEKKALKILYNKVRGNEEQGIQGLLQAGYDENTRILTLSNNTVNEELSILLTNSLYENLSRFYIEERLEKPLNTYVTLKVKVDSFETALKSAEYRLAKAIDTNRGLVSKSSALKQERIERETRVLALAYGKALENLEVADFSVKNSTPFFQIIDEPFAPIQPIKKSWILGLIFGGVLGGILGIVFVLGRKIYQEIME